MASVRGEFSGRSYDQDRIGLPIERRNIHQVRIDTTGIQIVARHLERFGDDEANALMLARLQAIAAGTAASTPYDLHFYAHELRESERYAALGYPVEQPVSLDEAYRLWNNVHTATLEEYGVRNERRELYHPDAQLILRKRGDF